MEKSFQSAALARLGVPNEDNKFAPNSVVTGQKLGIRWKNRLVGGWERGGVWRRAATEEVSTRPALNRMS